MSYRNPARIVDTQSGQHFRNMQQSLAKSFQGVIDQDTARIKADMVKAEKEQAALRKKLQTQEDEAYRSALQANQQTNTSVRYDNMQDNLAYNAQLAGRPAGSLTPEERTWQQNFKNVGSSIKTVLANIVSGREDYEKQKSIRPGQEGSIVATADNVNKQKAYEIFLNGNGGTSHAYFDGKTGETTVIARDLDGIEVGRVTSNGDMYEFATVVTTDKDRKSNVDNLVKSREKEGIQSSVYGENPQSTPQTDDTTGTTYYMIKPDEAATKAALRVSSLATVQSWSPDQQKNWYNSTQKGKPGFKAITASWTEDEKYVEVPDGEGSKMVPNENVDKVTDAFNNQTFEDNKQVLLAGKQIDKKALEKLTEKEDISLDPQEVYNDFQKDPVGLFYTYTGIKPEFDKKTKIVKLDITEKEGEEKEYLTYDLKKPNERNRFYMYLLENSKYGKGSSDKTKKFVKDFEEILKKSSNNKNYELITNEDGTSTYTPITKN